MRKNKIVVFGIISLFLVSGLANFPTTATSTSTSNQISGNNIVIENSDNYPDLISKTTYRIEKRGDFRIYWIYVQIKNIGNNVAIKPKGHPLFTHTAKYWYGETLEISFCVNNEYILEPGDSFWWNITEHFFMAAGSIRTNVVDPDDVVDEGDEGEKNNVEKFILLRTRNKAYINAPFLNFLENRPHMFSILKQLIRLRFFKI